MKTEFARIKDETVETLNRQAVNPGAVAANVFGTLVYGENSILGKNTLGTEEIGPAITMDDLKAHYDANFSPSISFITVAGDITQAEAIELFRPLEEELASQGRPDVRLPRARTPDPDLPSISWTCPGPNNPRSRWDTWPCPGPIRTSSPTPS